MPESNGPCKSQSVVTTSNYAYLAMTQAYIVDSQGFAVLDSALQHSPLGETREGKGCSCLKREREHVVLKWTGVTHNTPNVTASKPTAGRHNILIRRPRESDDSVLPAKRV